MKPLPPAPAWCSECSLLVFSTVYLLSSVHKNYIANLTTISQCFSVGRSAEVKNVTSSFFVETGASIWLV